MKKPTLDPSAAWWSRIAWVGLAVLMLLTVVRYAILVRPRAMEFDQFCTLFTAEAKTWHGYLAAVPADNQPPFSHAAARLGLMLPLPESIGVHLVSAIAFLTAALCLFRLFQKRGVPLAGLCSAALLAASRSMEYMYTLRPYAGLMAISAATLLVYDTYRQRRAAGVRGSLWPLSLLIVLAATIHALSMVYVLLPIVVGEGLYLLQTRRMDQRLLLAVALAATAFGFDFALARQIQTHAMKRIPLSARTPGLPTAAKLMEVLRIPVERRWEVLLLVGVLGVGIVLWRRRTRVVGDDALTPPGDWLFLLLAAGALYAASMLAFGMGVVNHYFFTRYASPAYLCGPLLLGVVLASAAWRRLPGLQVALAIVLLVLPLPALRTYLKSNTGASPTEANAPVFAHGEVIASPLAYPTLWWYASPEQRKQLRLVTDATQYRTIPDGIPEAVLRQFSAAGILPFSLTEYKDYQPGREVYLVAPDPSGDTWVPAELERRGYACNVNPGLIAGTYALTHCVLPGGNADAN